MSEPIKRGQIDQAPTPQNTPASVSNSYLKSQPPQIPTTIQEDEELRQKLLANPLLLSAIEGKLNTLIGTDSGYVDQLSKPVKNRVYGLKSLQEQQFKLERDFQEELLELERKFHAKYAPLHSLRSKIIAGAEEPTAEQIEEGKKLMKKDEEGEEEDEVDEEDEEDKEDDKEDKESKDTGIPSFWLTALENLNPISEIITERDSEILTSLQNVRMDYLDTPGFKLTFEFAPNDYFSDKALVKTYYYQKELGYSGDFIYDHAEGCEVHWKDNEHNATIEVEKRRQRNKHTKQVRTIEKLTPVDSFFNFFDPPVPPKPEGAEDEEDEKKEDSEDAESEADADEDEVELEQRLQMDYEVGELIKDKLVPRAVDWFTGDALQYEFDNDDELEEEDELEEGEEDGEDDDEDNDDDDDDDDDDTADGKAATQPQECKQQ